VSVASVLLLGCPEGYAAALPQGAQAIAATDLGDTRRSHRPDLVVIGPSNPQACVLAQRVGRAYPGADVLIAAPRSELDRLKDLIRISPYIPLRTDLVSSEPSELVGHAIRLAVARCELRNGHRAVLLSVRQAMAAPRAASRAAPDGPSSGATDSDRRRLSSFFHFYERVRREVLGDVARATPQFSTAVPVLGFAGVDGAVESDLEMSRLERAALLEDAWGPYVERLHAAGRTHAELGLGFGQWLELAHQFRCSLVERLLQRKDSAGEHFSDVLLGMESFLAITLREIERAYGEAQRAQLQRHEQNARLFAAAVESSDAAVLTTSVDGTITAHNPAAERLLGYRGGEALGHQLSEFTRENLRGELAGKLAAAARNVPTSGFETLWCNELGQERQVSLTVSPLKTVEGQIVGLSLVAHDITKQKQTEESLRQAQKMEAVGRLAGGIAHDFNNLLTVIMGHATFMISDYDGDGPEVEALEDILRAAERARALTQQLSSFSRGHPVEPARIDVNEAVRSTHLLLRRTFSENIEIAVLPKEDLWPVWMDRSQLDQLLMNLALNARDAMPAGGRLAIELENESLPEASGALPPGDYVRLRVSDTGIGMASDAVGHVFEPFFTTKPVGKGTGLGLATCHAIARRAGGDIRVSSEPGRGSVFSIWLPRATPGDTRAEPDAPGPEVKRLAGTETILVVEDEPAVRATTTRALEQHGYRVLQAYNGDDAQRIVERNQNIALVLTDVVMPQMNGPELAAHLAKTHPQLPVLFMSGYADDSVLTRDMVSHAAVISKPFLPRELARKVRQVLDDRARR
jgi:PAS domain S-box-containing protein